MQAVQQITEGVIPLRDLFQSHFNHQIFGMFLTAE